MCWYAWSQNYPVPLLQNESSCKISHMKINLIYMKTNLWGEHTFKWFVSQRTRFDTCSADAKETRKLPSDLGTTYYYFLHVCVGQCRPSCFIWAALKVYGLLRFSLANQKKRRKWVHDAVASLLKKTCSWLEIKLQGVWQTAKLASTTPILRA